MGKELHGIPKNKEEEIANQRFLLEAELERVKLAYYIIKSGKIRNKREIIWAYILLIFVNCRL